MTGPVIALSGGVGGAKLALGLSRIVDPADALTIVANTGDDFEHLGLYVSPDVDTLMYTLAGVANPETGWGREGETWGFLGALRELGGEDWFRLGDRDLAVHVERTRRLARGESLSEVTARLCAALRVGARVVPMSDEPVRTIMQTTEGDLGFQHYFVERRCEPRIVGVRYEGVERAKAARGLSAALGDPALGGVVVCPSNPFVSVDPILALDGVAERMRALEAPVVAVSPIVGEDAVKGPAAKMMRELGLSPSAFSVARHYTARGLLDGFVIDRADASLAPAIERLGARTLVTDIVMRSIGDRVRLATEVLAFIETIRGES